MPARAISWVFVVTLVAASAARGADRVEAVLGQDGRLLISRGNTPICELAAGLFDTQWSGATATPDTGKSSEPSARAVRLVTAGGAAIKGLVAVKAENEGLHAAYTFTPEQDVVLNSLHVGAEFSIQALAGGTWKADERSGKFPAEFGDTGLFSGAVRTAESRIALRRVVGVSLPSTDHDPDSGQSAMGTVVRRPHLALIQQRATVS